MSEARRGASILVSRWPGWWVVLLALFLSLTPVLGATEIIIYGFEGTLEGWAIPEWAKVSADYGGQGCLLSQEHVREGQHALELQAVFPGERWTGAYVEREAEVTDWSPFGRLSVDVYLPEYAPEGLAGKIILTVGSDWRWTEMNRSIPLPPGQWTTLSVDLRPGSMDWKFFPDEAFRQEVRRIGIRIESNHDSAYRGPVFLDNVRLAD